MRGENRETLRRRAHRSLKVWLDHASSYPLPQADELIVIADALWFRFGKQRKPYGCFVVLVRPVSSEFAHVAKIMVLPGKESKQTWRKVFRSLPKEARKRIVAMVADGNSGLLAVARENKWFFQWCHAHMKRKALELRGVRKLPGRDIRRKVTRIVFHLLETPNEEDVERCKKELRILFALPECPRSLPKRLIGFLKHPQLLRAYRYASELNLPVTTNSVEQVNSQIRFRYSAMRGVRSVTAFKYWITIIQKTLQTVRCRGYEETQKNHRKSVS